MIMNQQVLNEAKGEDPKFKAKRKKIENHVIKMFELMEPKGVTAGYYREKFDNMSDNQFKNYMRKLKNDEDEHFVMQIMPFENEFNYDDLKAAAKYLGVPLEEYLYYTDPNDGKVYRTKHPVSVGYIHIKRLRVKRSLRNFNMNISKGLVA